MAAATPTKAANDEPMEPSGASRRSFFKGVGVVAAGGAIATMHGTLLPQTASAATEAGANVLVVVSLRGGADGLSLVVPYGDPAYAPSRPTIGIPPSVLLQHDGMFGLHPRFAPLEQLWATGRMAAVQAVGQPQVNGSGFWATQQLEEADPGTTERLGWVNRLIGLTDPASPHGAVQIGDSIPQTAIYGQAGTLSVADIANLQIYQPARRSAGRRAALDVTWDHAGGLLGQAVRAGLRTADAWASMPQTSGDPQNGARYPVTDLGEALAQAAQSIRKDLGIAVITVDHAGWDMPANLGTYRHGRLERMVDDLASSLAAFFRDLGALGQSVTVLTLTEFGRQVQENSDAGVDDGYGSVMLVMGAGVKGGNVYGTWPGCAPAQTVQGGLAVTMDYRSVLAEVVTSRFPAVSVPVLFPGFDAEPVGVMQSG